MSLSLWLPLALAVLAGLSAGRLQRRLPPRLSAPVLTVVAAGSALAVAWGLAIVAFGFVVQIPVVAEWAGWCHLVLPGDDRVATPVGVWNGATVVSLRSTMMARRSGAPGAPTASSLCVMSFS